MVFVVQDRLSDCRRYELDFCFDEKGTLQEFPDSIAALAELECNGLSG